MRQRLLAVAELRLRERLSQHALGLIRVRRGRDEDHDNADCCAHTMGLT
jgi:hypothetical protein